MYWYLWLIVWMLGRMNSKLYVLSHLVLGVDNAHAKVLLPIVFPLEPYQFMHILSIYSNTYTYDRNDMNVINFDCNPDNLAWWYLSDGTCPFTKAEPGSRLPAAQIDKQDWDLAPWFWWFGPVNWRKRWIFNVIEVWHTNATIIRCEKYIKGIATLDPQPSNGSESIPKTWVGNWRCNRDGFTNQKLAAHPA